MKKTKVSLFKFLLSAFTLSMIALVSNSSAQTPPRDDTHWEPYGIGPDAEVYTIHTNLASFPLHMYVGGAFTNFEGKAANHIIRFNAEVWETLGGGVDGAVFAIASNLYPWNGVFVGGRFLHAINSDGSTVRANNIAFWDNNRRRWLPVGNGVDGEVLALAIGGTGGSSELFVGGNFTRGHSGPELNRIGKFDLYANTWEPLGNGVAIGNANTPIVRAIAVAARPSTGNFIRNDRNLVYVGGLFTEATNPDGGKTSSRNFILWNNASEQWQALGNGPNEEVLALALAPNHALYVGGRFTEAINADGSTARLLNRIALWDGNFYTPLGYGLNRAVTTIAPTFDHNRIVVGGEFTEATNSDLTRKPANYIAVFTRAQHPLFAQEWDVFGSGVNSIVNSIALVRPCPISSASEALHVAGAFSHAGNKNALGIAKWKYRATPPSRVLRGGVLSVTYSRGGGSGRATGRRVVSTSFSSPPPCTPGLGKSAASADEILADSLDFREARSLPETPFLEKIGLSVYDVENLASPITGANFEIHSYNPQLLVLMGVSDTTAHARNPEGFYIGESVMLHDLPVLAKKSGEARAVFVHAVTDAPAINVVATNGDTLVRGLRYGAVSNPLNLAAGNHTVELVRRSDRQKLGTYSFDLAQRAEDYVALTLSGFLDPGANQNGPALELGVYPVKFTPVTTVDEREESAPATFALAQNFPNPFNPVTSIQFSVVSDQLVSLKVYDVLGKEVATLVNERKPAGLYRVEFAARDLPSGVYFYKMTAGEFTAVRKLVLLR